MPGDPPWARVDDFVTGEARVFPALAETVAASTPGQVLDALRELERATAAGRWAVGYLGYEAAAALDPSLAVRASADDLPLLWFGIGAAPQAAPVVAPVAGYQVGAWGDAWTPSRYAAKVTEVRARIAAGDTYQCNLTTRLTARLEGDPFGLYADLAVGQQAAYNAYLDLGDWTVASASPELFFRIDAGRLLLRPMKGTAARGASPAEDAALALALRSSVKERAENVMIVDLLRNDAARVARPGTVSVPHLWRLEQYPTVHQLTSDVTAELRPDAGLVDVVRALFPCGSVTGAPKASTMALIAELETSARGVYCGAIGVIAPPGVRCRARFSVAIRTAVVDRRTGTATYGVGSGITWPSEPAAEYAELQAKAAVVRQAEFRRAAAPCALKRP
jgi:para-aminobenzoate synthetase/4-amino-4-deoxychorismate lyase